MKTKVKRISIAIKKQRRYIGKQLLLTFHQKEWRQEDNGTFESHKRKKKLFTQNSIFINNILQKLG